MRAGRARPGGRGGGAAAAAGGDGGRRRGAVGPHHAALFRPAAGGADAGLVGRGGAGAEGGGVRYRVRHVTAYPMRTPVDLASHMLHLTPRALPGQAVLSASLAADAAAVAGDRRRTTISATTPPGCSSTCRTSGSRWWWRPRSRWGSPRRRRPDATPPWEDVVAGLRAGARGLLAGRRVRLRQPAGAGRPRRRAVCAAELPAGPAGAGGAAGPERAHPAATSPSAPT